MNLLARASSLLASWMIGQISALNQLWSSSELAPNMFGASSELAPNMFGASSELASIMEFGFKQINSCSLCLWLPYLILPSGWPARTTDCSFVRPLWCWPWAHLRCDQGYFNVDEALANVCLWFPHIINICVCSYSITARVQLNIVRKIEVHRVQTNDNSKML